MSTERENRAWHIAGHAYAATMCGIPVHKLSLDGFSEADLEDRGDAQMLDEWTLLRPSESPAPVGTYRHTFAMERMMSIAVAGPAAELLHQKLPCILPSVQQFTDDWNLAWNAAGFIWNDEAPRLNLLTQWIHSSEAVIFHGVQEFYTRVVPQLLDRGTMTGDEVQAAWDQMKAAEEASQSRRERPRRPIRYSEETEAFDWPPLQP